MDNYKIATFQSKNGDVQCYLVDGDIYLSQKEMAKLFNISRSAVNKKVKTVEEKDEKVSKWKFTQGIKPTICYSSKTVFELAKIIGDFSIIDFQKWVNEQLHSTEIIEDNHYKIVRFIQDNIELDVRISPEENTVWLTQNQIAQLFEIKQPAVSKHITNIFGSKELDYFSVHSILEYTAKDGKKYKVDYFNLDVILAVGYRVNNNRGILFRNWATSILKKHMLIYNEKEEIVTWSEFANLAFRVQRIQEKLNAIASELEIRPRVFSNGEVFDAIDYLRTIIQTANKTIIILDNYADDATLSLLSHKKDGVKCYIIAKKKGANLSDVFVKRFDKQYGPLKIFYTNKNHDRSIIIDTKNIYWLGGSLNSLGNTGTIVVPIEDEISKEALIKYVKGFMNQ